MKDYVTELQQAQQGKEVADLIRDVLHAKHIFSYGELLLMPSVQELRGSVDDAVLNTLELFSYGTFKDYKSNPEGFLELSDDQLYRLKVLTLVSLSCRHKLLRYSTLHEELNTSSTRELEDLIIDAVYHDLLTAKIDQKNELLRVLSCTTRDITMNDINTIVDNANVWKNKICRLILSIQENSSIISSSRLASQNEAETLRTVIGANLQDIIAADDACKISGSASSSLGTSAMHNRARPKRSRGYQSLR